MRKTTLLILSLLLAACASPSRLAAPEPGPPIERDMVWQLVAIRGKEVKTSSVTLSINTETNSLFGQAACNRYFANYTLSGSSLSLQPLTHTDMQCPEADMLAEERYLNLLQKADSISWTAYELVLYQRNREILRYELR